MKMHQWHQNFMSHSRSIIKEVYEWFALTFIHSISLYNATIKYDKLTKSHKWYDF